MTSTLSLVPDVAVANQYAHRTIGGKKDFEIFDYARRHNLNVLLEGPTGSAKTTAIMAYAAKNKLRFYSVSSSGGTEPSQLFGKFIPDAKSGDGFVWQDGPVTELFRNGGILLLNEINFIPERIQSVLFSALDARREIQLLDHQGEVIRAHKDLTIFADMNPDYQGTRPLNAALRNRFPIQLVWDYDSKVEAKLIHSVSLRHLGDGLRAAFKRGEIETPVSTNLLMEFERIASAVSVDFALVNFANHFHADERQVVDTVTGTVYSNLVNEIQPSSQQGEFVIEQDEDDVEDTQDESVELTDGFVDEEGRSLDPEDWDIDDLRKQDLKFIRKMASLCTDNQDELQMIHTASKYTIIKWLCEA